jgi:preprotein translocase SecE subunit
MSTATETDESATANPTGDSNELQQDGYANDASDVRYTTARLGVVQWIIFAFALSALVAFWVLKNVIVTVWDRFAEPDPIIATAVAAVVSIGGAILLYRKPNVHAFAKDVAVEYSQVQWPTREEAWSHTAVVIVVSIVASLILAVYDLGWSQLTDLLYRV